jgi:hypothetical protein
MAFPTGVVIPTTNLSTAAADPSLARADLFTTVTAVNDIISSADQASGMAMLTATGKYDGAKFPTTITGTNVIAPTSGVLNIQDIIRLTTITAVDILALTGNALGDIAISNDAAGGNAALCLYDGTNWRYLAMGNLTVV